ncbi:MAG: methyltransferase [Rhodobacterales bacterium]|nr:MAG: methyltransferase [Rhodobacterales bacterium]
MKDLETILRDIISQQGPISLADYMAECLLHPDFGYYATRDPFGETGDFVTAPEISQMFGELLGLALAQAWLDQGAHTRFTLAELGPGRGTLMADLLRATRSVPGFHDAAQVVLVEASDTLRACQRDRLLGHDPGYDVVWTDHAADLPQQPLYLIANEFFDALPIRQFVRQGPGWCERRIGASETGLTLGLAPMTQHPALAYRLDDTRDGDIVETCPSASGIMGEIGERIQTYGGAALIIDYGDWRALGDTFQALKDHAPADPLIHPGQADLTAHVDFEALTRATPSAFTKLTPQGVFLERLGITDRARALARSLSGEPLGAHIAAHRRLTHPSEMGTLFKVLGLYPTTATPPTGLEP